MAYDWFVLAYVLTSRLYNHTQYKNKRCEAIYTKTKDAKQKNFETFTLD